MIGEAPSYAQASAGRQEIVPTYNWIIAYRYS